jgi:ABC-type lipopolysaccharide export system ATPase subunit
MMAKEWMRWTKMKRDRQMKATTLQLIKEFKTTTMHNNTTMSLQWGTKEEITTEECRYIFQSRLIITDEP